MSRTYNQDCVLAYALDILGERWTLLIVRELMLGPRRFADLVAGLPGIGTNLLSKRLKEMEGLGIVEQDASAGGRGQYRLAAFGEMLRPTIRSLMKWSVKYFLAQTQPSQVSACIRANDLNPDSVALAAELFPTADDSSASNYVARVTIDDSDYSFFCFDNDLVVRRGSDAPAIAHLRFDLETAMQALRGEISPQTFLGKIDASGPQEVIAHLVSRYTPYAHAEDEAREPVHA